jgi:hypothetical protein
VEPPFKRGSNPELVCVRLAILERYGGSLRIASAQGGRKPPWRPHGARKPTSALHPKLVAIDRMRYSGDSAVFGAAASRLVTSSDRAPHTKRLLVHWTFTVTLAGALSMLPLSSVARLRRVTEPDPEGVQV